MSEFIRVNCNVTNGVKIHNSEEAPRDGANGERRFVPVGDPVELRPGINNVDKKFFATWLKMNSGSDLVVNHLIEFDEGELK